MTTRGIWAVLLISAAVAAAQEQGPEGQVVDTKTLILTGTQGSAGLWQQRLPAFPEGHTLTFTVEPMADTFRSSRPKESPRMKLRLGPPGSEEYLCDNQGQWVSHYTPMGQAITIPAVKGAALFTSLTVGAQFKLTVVVRKPAPAAARPSPPPAAPGSSLGGPGDLGGLAKPPPSTEERAPPSAPAPGGRVQGW